jgi:hypothetical protein
LFAYKSRANVKSECNPQTKQYIDVDADDADGGGVVIPMKLFGLCDIEFDIGEGIL